MKPLRSQRLQRVADIAGRHTDEAANIMGERMRGLDAAKRQLQELQQFRRDYAQQPTPCRESGVSVAELMNRQRFVTRIDQAIAQQQREIEERERYLAQARVAWLESHSRSTALDTVTQRYRSREQASEERAEQAAVDERMQRQKNVRVAP
ncbi:MAG TPA: flagellar export protein FliJ [Rhodanobacteraceae bacterium]|nr:flagellar export protein FliJ [Rhodanobacteraceae bacterium]